MESFGKKCDSVSKAMTTAGRTLTTVMTSPILALGTAAIKASVSYESAFASVRKTVNATEAEYEQLSRQIKTMSTEVLALQLTLQRSLPLPVSWASPMIISWISAVR